MGQAEEGLSHREPGSLTLSTLSDTIDAYLGCLFSLCFCGKKAQGLQATCLRPPSLGSTGLGVGERGESVCVCVDV